MRCSSSWSFQPRLSAIVISPEHSTRDFIEPLYVIEVFGPTTVLLEGPQVIEPHDVHSRAVVQDRVEPARPGLLEVERLFDEEVDLCTGVTRTPEREHSQPFLLTPLRASFIVREVLCRNRGTGPIVERPQRRDRGRCIRRRQIQHEVEVCREPRMTVKDHSDAADHQVASIRIIEGSKDLRERTTGHLRSVSRAGQPGLSVTK